MMWLQHLSLARWCKYMRNGLAHIDKVSTVRSLTTGVNNNTKDLLRS
jgi:hypothetical protein